MIFKFILTVMALGDLMWCAASLRLRHRWARWLGFSFGAVQIAGLAALFISRRGVPLEEMMPRPLHSMLLAWHLLILLPWLAWRSTAAIASLGAKAFRGMRGTGPLPSAEVRPVEMQPAAAGPGDLTRREFLGAAAALTPPMLTFGAAGVGETQLDGFRIRRLDVPVPGLPPALDGVTIAHLTDFHVGRFTRGRVLERMVEETNRLDADLVALTGDFINHSLRDLPAALDVIRALRARSLVAACEGNHDLIENARTFRMEAERGGMPLLLGGLATAEVRGQRVQLMGVPWSHSEDATRDNIRALLARRDASAWPLLLAHHPHAWDAAEGIPLTLAGHTHGGQLMLSERMGFGPAMFRYWSGLYTRPDRSLVVSNGIGNWFPIRIQAPAELLHLTLRRAVTT